MSSNNASHVIEEVSTIILCQIVCIIFAFLFITDHLRSITHLNG